MNILIVDDRPSHRRDLRDALRGVSGIELHCAASLDEARAILRRVPVDVALIDLCLGPGPDNQDGLILVEELRGTTAVVPIVVSVAREQASIRAAMRKGAYDYILKDEMCEEMVVPIIQTLQQRWNLQREVTELRARLVRSEMVGASQAMVRLRDTIQRVARAGGAVLIQGPTGSGKELVARAIHAAGPQHHEPFLAINCGAIVDTLAESELFGHTSRAGTGVLPRDGYFHATGKGTLFLDEINSLPMTTQIRLLRVLSDRTFTPVGSEQPRVFQGRIIAAANAELEELVQRGKFREDLLFRLNVLPVRVPTLDERKEDIPALVAHFARRAHRALHFGAEATALLMQRSWPGNVRQLESLVLRLSTFAEGDVVTPEVVLEHMDERRDPGDPREVVQQLARAALQLPPCNKLDVVKRALVQEALLAGGGRQARAAQLLGVERRVVARILHRASEESADEE